jgi:ABC-type Co2+ transport system permease subunit
MSIVAVWVSYAIFVGLKKILPKTKSSVTAAAAIAALLSVPAAAASFVTQYAIGANATFSVSAVLTAMVGTHILIGIGEALITLFAVGAVLASRSDLVYGYKNEQSKLEIRKSA